jgi:hypothetical protein
MESYSACDRQVKRRICIRPTWLYAHLPKVVCLSITSAWLSCFLGCSVPIIKTIPDHTITWNNQTYSNQTPADYERMVWIENKTGVRYYERNKAIYQK